jgi:WD40 repeat protein
MAFHPSSPVLVSGSRDFTLKFFDISKPSIKKAYRSIQVERYIGLTSLGRFCQLKKTRSYRVKYNNIFIKGS